MLSSGPVAQIWPKGQLLSDLQPATIASYRSAIGAFVEWCEREGLYPEYAIEYDEALSEYNVVHSPGLVGAAFVAASPLVPGTTGAAAASPRKSARQQRPIHLPWRTIAAPDAMSAAGTEVPQRSQKETSTSSSCMCTSSAGSAPRHLA